MPLLEPGQELVYLQCVDPECPNRRPGTEHAHGQTPDTPGMYSIRIEPPEPVEPAPLSELDLLAYVEAGSVAWWPPIPLTGGAAGSMLWWGAGSAEGRYVTADMRDLEAAGLTTVPDEPLSCRCCWRWELTPAGVARLAGLRRAEESHA